MKTVIMALVVASLFPAVSGAISIEKEAFLFDRAQEAIKETLKDPDSAKFSDMVANEEFMAVCGKVNAKNSMGGYVGKKRFISNGQITVLEGRDMDTAEFADSWRQICTAN